MPSASTVSRVTIPYRSSSSSAIARIRGPCAGASSNRGEVSDQRPWICGAAGRPRPPQPRPPPARPPPPLGVGRVPLVHVRRYVVEQERRRERRRVPRLGLDQRQLAPVEPAQ